MELYTLIHAFSPLLQYMRTAGQREITINHSQWRSVLMDPRHISHTPVVTDRFPSAGSSTD